MMTQGAEKSPALSRLAGVVVTPVRRPMNDPLLFLGVTDSDLLAHQLPLRDIVPGWHWRWNVWQGLASARWCPNCSLSHRWWRNAVSESDSFEVANHPRCFVANAEASLVLVAAMLGRFVPPSFLEESGVSPTRYLLRFLVSSVGAALNTLEHQHLPCCPALTIP